MNVTVAEMKASLSEVLRKAASGEEVIVTKHGKPYVRVSRDKPTKSPLPRVGAFEKKPFRIADDFDELGPEGGEYVR